MLNKSDMARLQPFARAGCGPHAFACAKTGPHFFAMVGLAQQSLALVVLYTKPRPTTKSPTEGSKCALQNANLDLGVLG